MKMNNLKLIFIALISLLLYSTVVVGQVKTDITPKEELNLREDPRERSTVVSNKVEVTVGSDMWDGEEVVSENVIPLRVTIDSGNEDPIAITYENFRLVTYDGKEYSALPVYGIDVNQKKIVVEKKLQLIPEPVYELQNYSIYPIYSPIYTDFVTTDYDYVIDPEFQEKFIRWETMEGDLPTNNMRMKALPEGVLDIDGIISGFLYFEAVDSSDKEVTFMFDIVNAENGKKKGTVEIPFYVM